MISEDGIALLKEFERGRDPKTGKLLPIGKPATEAYDDGGGVWTISWGLTGPEIKRGTVWTPKKCEAEFIRRVEKFEADVLALCKQEPTVPQMDAMVCLAFNIGIAAFKGSTVLRLHNQGKWAEAANAFSMWKKDNGVVVAGLVHRRAREAALYLTPVDHMEIQTAVIPQSDDPAVSKVNIAGAATGLSVVAGVAQQTVANVASVWDSINAIGIDPRVIMLLLGGAGVLALAWFVYDAYARRVAGDR